VASELLVRIAVLTVSDTRTVETDTSGRMAADLLKAAGHEVAAHRIVKDDIAAVREQFQAWIADDNIDVIIATGGTGITPRDITPEALEPLVSKPIPGFGELFRYLSYLEIGTSAMHSGAGAGLSTKAYVFFLPGSTKEVRLGVEKIIVPQLDINNKPCSLTSLLPRIRNEKA